MAAHRGRSFAEKAQVLDDFQRSRDILLRIRRAGGLPAGGVLDAWLADEAAALDASRRSPPRRATSNASSSPSRRSTPAEALKTFETVDGFASSRSRPSPWCTARSPRRSTRTGTCTSPRCSTIPTSPGPASTRWGRVRLLRDTDGDGRFDQSHVFADGLLWAAGIAPWKGGVFVTAPPDIWYLKDTDGDHRADVRRKVFTGFGTENEQGW